MNIVMTLLAFIVAASAAQAQPPAAPPPIEINDLRTPNSPAFVLLDVTPASVERPESPKAFVLNLLTTVSQSEGLPKDYALQITPYWLRSHPDLTFGDYQQPNPAASMLRTMTFSVATSPLLDTSAAGAATIGTRIGLGVRTNIVGGRPNPAMKEKLDTLEAINLKLLDAPADEALRAQARTAALDLQGLDQQRVGLFVSAAAGQIWSMPQDDVEQRRRDRWGVWVTPAYRFLLCRGDAAPCKSVIDAIGVVRAIRDRDDEARWDLGARLLGQPSDPFTISSEFVRRRGREDNDPSSDRTVATMEYRIREDLLLFGSFGRDFQEGDDSRRTLVSLLGLSFGFGAKPLAAATP